MRIEVSGVRLFFGVEGAKLVLDGPVMRERPTLILLHGGPGGDHSRFKPELSQLGDICLPGARHGIFADEPEAALRIIREFVLP